MVPMHGPDGQRLGVLAMWTKSDGAADAELSKAVATSVNLATGRSYARGRICGVCGINGNGWRR